jgi:halogenation protein CepH
MARQIPLFHQFMENIPHPLDEMKETPGIKQVVDRTKDFRKADRLDDEDVPIVNGQLESTWRIDRESHALAPVRGVTFDRERPVFSSTSSWLLGRNVAQLPHEAYRLLELVDGTTPWASIVSRYALQEGLTPDESRARMSEIVAPLLAERHVLRQSTAQASLSGSGGQARTAKP